MGLKRKMEGDLLILENPENGERILIHESIKDGEAWIAPEGRLGIEAVHDLEDELTSMALICSCVTLDLSSVDYMANSVFRTILDVQHTVDNRNGALRIRGVSDSLWSKFEEMGLEDVFDLERDQ